MMDELRPCPFCGGKAKETHYSEWGEPGNLMWRIKCSSCHAQMAGTHHDMNRAAWNRRTVEQDDGFFKRFGMTPHAAARVMSNCIGFVRDFIDGRVFATSTDDGLWRAYLQEFGVDADGWPCPSGYFEYPDDAVLFKELIGSGTYYGGMTSAIEAVNEIGVRL